MKDRGPLVAWAVGIGVALLVVISGFAIYLLLSVHQLQESSHATGVGNRTILVELQNEIKVTNVIAKEIVLDEQQAAKGSTTVSQILVEAGAAVDELEMQEQAICAATPNCLPVKGTS